MTKDCVDFCRALDLVSFDVMGFSLGGMIAQQLAQDHPDMIRRIILLGAGPRGGEGMTFTELSADELDDPVALLMGAPHSRERDKPWLDRHARLDRLAGFLGSRRATPQDDQQRCSAG
jgi:pimeloyl-ACP methyl ester carboxylesterase